MPLRRASNPIFSRLFSVACVGGLASTAVYMYNYEHNREQFVNRDGVTVHRNTLTQRERFERFAGSLSSSTTNASSSSSSSSSNNTDEPVMTLEEFIASFLPDGTLPPSSSSSSSSSANNNSKNANNKKNRFAALTKVFEQLDANGDGVLSFSEYCALFCFISADDEHFKTAFKMFDENDSNTLDAKEFDYLLKALNPDPSTKLLFSEATSKNKSSILHTFFGPKLDKNLSFTEFEGILRRLRAAVQEAEFDAVDIDGRGELNATELRRLMFDKKKGGRSSDNKKMSNSGDADGADAYNQWASERREALRKHYREGDEHLTASKSTYLKFCEIIRCSNAIMNAMQLYVENKKRLALKATAAEEGSGATSNKEGGGDADGGCTIDDNNIGLNEAEFLRAVRIGIQNNRIQLTPREMELFFAVFDGNKNGVIEPREFKELCRINQGFGSGYYRDFTLPQLGRMQQFQLCMMQRDK